MGLPWSLVHNLTDLDRMDFPGFGKQQQPLTAIDTRRPVFAEASPEFRSRRRIILLLIAVVAIGGQIFFSNFVPPEAAFAGSNGLSASLGLAQGDGMTISQTEAIAVRNVDPSFDIRELYSPGQERMPLIEPLPGVVLIYFLIGLTGLPLSLNLLVLVNALIIAVGAVVLASELMTRRFALGVVTGLVSATFIPMYRLSMDVGYDVFEFMFILGAVVCLLKFQRTSDLRWLLANGVCLGLGLWIRSYFILYVAAQAVVVGILLFRREASLRSMIGWAIPIVLLATVMISVRDSGSTGTLLTRGAFWHTFWMGVGQFENDQIDVFQTGTHAHWPANLDLMWPVIRTTMTRDFRTCSSIGSTTMLCSGCTPENGFRTIFRVWYATP